MRKLFHDDELGQLYDTNRIFLYSNHYYDSSSRIYEFGNLPEQKNATEEEQEAFPSKTINSFNIDNLDELNNTRSTVH
ncbi:unnamed protein product [Rhizophagus irregularis]|nr:unnamed protein product [Rhizophagus irregularis]